MSWMWLLVALPILAAIGGAMSTAMKAGSFQSLGNITGKSLEEITSVVGQPNSTSAHVNGTLYQWIGTSAGGAYHYAILFDHEGKAVGYTHQHTS